MKIGIVTFHCSYNFGSALQAFALKQYLVNKGHDVHIIDYRSKDFDAYRLFRCSGLKSVVVDFLLFPKNLRRRNAFQAFWRDYFNLTDQTYRGNAAEEELQHDMQAYDALICGSDQIWNLDCTKGPDAPFFLSFASDSSKRIAYAPSLAHARFRSDYFTDNDRARISYWLNKFDALSVREASVAEQFRQLTKKNIEEVLDPTLLLDVQDYRNVESPQLPNGIEKGKYIFAYTLWENDRMYQYVDALAQKYNLTIVYYSGKKIHYESPSINIRGVGPREFLSLIDHAYCIVSNSFHATVFSILYGKPFVTFGTEKSSSRMYTLLGKLGLSPEHIISSDSDGHIPTEPFAPELDYIKLQELRKGSEDFLCNAHCKALHRKSSDVLSPFPRIHFLVDDLLERLVHLRSDDFERRCQAAVVLSELDGEHSELPYRFGA